MRAPLKPDITLSGSSRRTIREDVSLTTRMPLRKVIQGHPGRWTITDANLSPDNERYRHCYTVLFNPDLLTLFPRLIYSSIVSAFMSEIMIRCFSFVRHQQSTWPVPLPMGVRLKFLFHFLIPLVGKHRTSVMAIALASGVADSLLMAMKLSPVEVERFLVRLIVFLDRPGLKCCISLWSVG